MRLFLAGDVMTGRGVDQVMAHPGDPIIHERWAASAVRYVELAEERNGPIPRPVAPEYPWGELPGILEAEGAFLRIANLETAITDGGSPWPGKGIHYRMHPGNVETLQVAGLDCLTLANNHVLDWSYPGLAQTLETLQEAGIRACGAGADAGEASRPAPASSGSGGVLMIGLGVASSGIPGEWAASGERPGVYHTVALTERLVGEIAARVEQVKSGGAMVVASIHWGGNWGFSIPEPHRRFARALVERAGVDVVHGHSAHHPLGVEVHGGRLILYGCGDLINDYEGIPGREEFHPDLRLGYVAELEDGRLGGLEMIPMRTRRLRLEPAPIDEVEWLATVLNREGERLGTSVEVVEGRLRLRW